MILKNSRHEASAQYLAEGRTATDAATLAGYSERSARKQGSRLQFRLDVFNALNNAQPGTPNLSIDT